MNRIAKEVNDQLGHQSSGSPGHRSRRETAGNPAGERGHENCRGAGLDLVEVAPNSQPPVCRIMNYGKYKYQQSKRTQEARKHQTVIQVKEVKVRPRTEEHDFQFKLRHVKRFLSEGNKVKISMLFRGREIAHPEFGKEMLNRFIEEVKEDTVLEQPPRLEGRNMVMILAPKS